MPFILELIRYFLHYIGKIAWKIHFLHQITPKFNIQSLNWLIWPKSPNMKKLKYARTLMCDVFITFLSSEMSSPCFLTYMVKKNIPKKHRKYKKCLMSGSTPQMTHCALPWIHSVYFISNSFISTSTRLKVFISNWVLMWLEQQATQNMWFLNQSFVKFRHFGLLNEVQALSLSSVFYGGLLAVL